MEKNITTKAALVYKELDVSYLLGNGTQKNDNLKDNPPVVSVVITRHQVPKVSGSFFAKSTSELVSVSPNAEEEPPAVEPSARASETREGEDKINSPLNQSITEANLVFLKYGLQR